MADVFVSYARADEQRARAVSDRLRKAGHKVWRDDELPAHRAYAEVIEERLRSAKAVVVLWSADAVKSQWVRAEGDAARNAGTLVQASLDGAIPPLPFNQIQCAILAGGADAEEAGWHKLISSVEALAGTTELGRPEAPTSRRERSICVLPFVNMSGDAEQEYFSDGISEDITTDLSKVSALRVTARNTAFTFKGQAVDIPGVARKLDVSHVLEGSVRKAGGRVRITAQLIDGATGDHVWADRYDRDLTDIFAIQDEISKAIVAALKLKLLPEEKKAIEQRGTSNVDAYSLYLMARQYWATGVRGNARADEIIVRICRRATEIDPSYAHAWAVLALAQTELRFRHGRFEEDGIGSAERALQLDPSIAEAHSVRARYLFEQGRRDDADEAMRLALKLDPDSVEVNRESGRLLVREDRCREAIPFFERAVSLIESDFHSWGMLVSCYHTIGDTEGQRRAAAKAVEHAEKALSQDQSNETAFADVAYALAALGERERAREWVHRAMLVNPGNLVMSYNLACAVAIFLGDADTAIDLLRGFFEQSARSDIEHASRDPDLDPIRGDPRFREMLEAARERVAA